MYFLLSSNVEGLISWLASFVTDETVELNFWVLLIMKGFAYTLTLYYVYQPLSLIFLAPLFSILSESVQDCLNERKTTFSFNRFWSDVKRGVKIGFKNVLIQFPILMVLFFIGIFAPPLAPFTLGASFFITSYFYGFTMLDYRNEYYRLNSKESRNYVNSNFFQSLSVGAVFNLLLFIPVLGTIFGPAYALVATALSSDSKEDA